jgi:hypothetical protein
MKIKLKTNVIHEFGIHPEGTVLDFDPKLIERGLAEPFDPDAKPEPKISDEEVAEAAQEPASPPEWEPEPDTPEDADEEPTEALIATYSGGGWYQLSNGTKCRRKDLPEDAVLEV